MADKTVRDAFTSGQVARITGINYRTLDHWARTGFITPSIAAAGGSGTDRVYSFKDLLALCIARDLRAQGISTRALKRIAEQLRRSEGTQQPLAEVGFIVTGNDVLKVGATPEELISLIARPNQTAFAFVFDV